jgi:DNA-binding PadR family transcriptional regulator
VTSIYRSDISNIQSEEVGTVLELAVLGLLKEKPMYGYEVKKRLDERLGHTWKFSYGSLYPTLKKLAKVEAVEMESPDGEIVRKKKFVYRITPKGESMFEALLDEAGAAATEDREAFMLRLAFFRYTKPETRTRLLERRRGYLQDRLAKMKESLKNLRERVDAYSLELMQYGANETEHDIRWLETMIEAERNGTNGNGPGTEPTRFGVLRGETT